jgi:hypothetical protein
MTGYSGNNGHVTYFVFKTDNTSQCVLVNISTVTPATVEISLFNACNSGVESPAGGIFNHGMCMNTGSGLWAPNLFSNLQPNTNYYLRVRTQQGYTGDLKISSMYYTPLNDDCFGATSIGTTAVSDNNACHTPGPGIPASELCATTLENTAWYTFVVQNNGASTILIDKIECNNGNGDNNNGFQIGFFSGSCSSLTPISCSTGAGGSVTATATNLAAGTRIYVAIDGYSGSNCSYVISATNSIILPIRLQSFAVMKAANYNLAIWTTREENNTAYFELQRSTDQDHFEMIHRMPGQASLTADHAYEVPDNAPPLHAFYRLKMVDKLNQFSYSNILEVKRKPSNNLDISPPSYYNGQLKLNIQSPASTQLQVKLSDIAGRIMLHEFISCQAGQTTWEKNISNFPAGKYIVIVQDGAKEVVKGFYKY